MPPPAMEFTTPAKKAAMNIRATCSRVIRASLKRARQRAKGEEREARFVRALLFFLRSFSARCSSPLPLRALPRRVRMAGQFKNKLIRSEQWQTLLFVRNQMALILSKARSTFTTPQEIRFRPMIGPGLLFAVAELHRTS